MDYVYIATTDDGKTAVFSTRDSAIVYCWNYYMSEKFTENTLEDIIEVWESLMMDLEIEDVCYIDCQEVIPGVVPHVTILYDPSADDDSED